MVKGYKKFNEARRHKSKPQRRGGNFNANWEQQVARNTKAVSVEPHGMNMVYGEKFKFILDKISKKGNKIAKELLTLPNKPDARFEQSYIDITRREDTLSFLPNGARDLPEDKRFDNNKRQQAKIYKTIKTIFGSKYTKDEVTKFVSMFKGVYNVGPDPVVSQVDPTVPKKTDEEVVKKIIEDTKDEKLVWKEGESGGNMRRYDATITITPKKRLVLCFYHFPNTIKEETMSFITVNFYNDLGKTQEDKRIWIQTYKFDQIIDFLQTFKYLYLLKL